MAYNELEGTELERSANLFDLSYVPESMSFDDDVPRDEATELTQSQGGLDFVTDVSHTPPFLPLRCNRLMSFLSPAQALRHSKVKLTWDDDDTTRVKVTRKRLTKKEIEENDFKAYIASSSESEGHDSDDDADFPAIMDTSASAETQPQPTRKTAKQLRDERRANLRSLLSNTDDVPEGWGGIASSGAVGEMEVTFTPGLSSRNAVEEDGGEEETTLERYQRRMKEKKVAKKAKRDAKAFGVDGEEGSVAAPAAAQDEFFGEDSDDASKNKPKANSKSNPPSSSVPLPDPSTPAELSLLLSPSTALSGPKHFDMKEVIRAEKDSSSKKNRFQKRKEKKQNATVVDEANREDGAGFSIDVADPRFAALHEQPEYAIDPSNPQ